MNILAKMEGSSNDFDRMCMSVMNQTADDWMDYLQRWDRWITDTRQSTERLLTEIERDRRYREELAHVRSLEVVANADDRSSSSNHVVPPGTVLDGVRALSPSDEDALANMPLEPTPRLYRSKSCNDSLLVSCSIVSTSSEELDSGFCSARSPTKKAVAKTILPIKSGR